MSSIGYTTIGGTTVGDSPGVPVYVQYTAGSSFTATRMFLYTVAVGSVSASEITMGIYADAAGVPGALLGSTVGVPYTLTPAWLEADLHSPVSIVSGTIYWLAVNSNSPGIFLYFDTGSVTSRYSIDAYVSGSMPATLTTPGPFSSTDKISIYADTAAAPVAPTLSTLAVPSAGNTLTGTLSQSGCLPTSGTGLFTLAGTAATVATWAISGTTLTLTLGGLVRSGETVTLSYPGGTTAGTDISEATQVAFMAVISAASVTNNSTQITPTAQFIVPGDSIAYGYPGTGQGTIGGATWEATTFLALGPTWTGQNFAQSGTTFASSEGWDEVTVDLAYNGSLSHNVLIGPFGTNDCGSLASGALVYAGMLTWLANRRAANPGWKVIIPTVMPADSGGAAAAFEIIRAAYNTLLRANYQSLNITLCDVAMDARIGAPGAQLNATYFADTVHPTDLGRVIYGGYVSAAIWQALLPVVASGGIETFTHSGQRRRSR